MFVTERPSYMPKVKVFHILMCCCHGNYIKIMSTNHGYLSYYSQQRRGCLYSVLFCNIWRCKIFIVHTIWKFVKHDKLKTSPQKPLIREEANREHDMSCCLGLRPLHYIKTSVRIIHYSTLFWYFFLWERERERERVYECVWEHWKNIGSAYHNLVEKDVIL